MKITVLVDNTASEDAGFTAEHGLSLWIEAAGLRILFDSGQGPALPRNAERLGIDVAAADHLVLSHGHYDHAGGLAWVLDRNDHAVLHLHPAASRARYSVRPDLVRSIGIPSTVSAAVAALPPERVRRSAGPSRLAPGVGLTGAIPRESAFEDTGGPFFVDPWAHEADAIEDDQALWLETDEGLVVCLGCGHSGVVNTLAHVRRLTGVDQVRAVLGGFHLRSAPAARLAATAEALEALDADVIAPCHCTGAGATEALAAALGDRVQPPSVGTVLSF